jgi:hypothetical protein
MGSDRPTFTRARALARRLAALEEGTMRTRAAARALAAEAPAAAARLLAEAMALAGEGESALAAALGEALLAPGPDLAYDHLAAIYAAAVAGGHEEVRGLLVAPAPRRAYAEPADRVNPGLSHLTLGHKKSLARGHRDPDLLARLAAEGEPTVVRELLRNPRLTEELVIRIAARRPCRPETLRCLHEDSRWRRRPAVARAIALNPFAEPELVAKLLPRLGRRELVAIGADASLHALVRALAARLVSGKLAGPGGAPAEEG